MENNNRPVFESFDEFIKFVYEAKVYEAETGYIGSLVDILTGGMKLKGSPRSSVEELVSKSLDKYYTDSVEKGKEMAESISKKVKEAFDILNNDKISTKGSVSATSLAGTFNYLEAATVNAEGHADNNPDNSGLVLTTERLPLAELLARVNKHNLLAFYTNVKKASEKTNKNDGDEFVNSGTEVSVKGFKKRADADANCKFIEIIVKSLGSETIQFTKYDVEEAVFVQPTGKYAWQFPIYAAFNIIPGGGNVVDSSIYDEVIQPAGSSVEVTDKEYNSSGINFFEENAVVISESGKKAINAILSQYNLINKITVNGGASSKATSRAGGNEKLAKDRQVAGIAILNELKKSGVAQLKSAAVTAGKAAVQAAAPTESDPKNQQVSFIISGKIKSTEVVEKVRRL